MYLAYIDDSGSDRANPIIVMGAVVVIDKSFWKLDLRSASIAEYLVPADKQEGFEEFKAADLFGGYGAFTGVNEDIRHDIIRALLSNLDKFAIPFIYSAVDKRALDASAFGSSMPIDVAFRICACGVDDWIRQDVASRAIRQGENTQYQHAKLLFENPYLLVADDTDDKALKNALRKSFRALRPLARSNELESAHLVCCHDDMYFGDSQSSIGIQLADLCAHVMLRKFRDGIHDEFYHTVVTRAICAKPEPFWEHCKAVMKNHEDHPGLLPSLLTLAARAPGPEHRGESSATTDA